MRLNFVKEKYFTLKLDNGGHLLNTDDPVFAGGYGLVTGRWLSLMSFVRAKTSDAQTTAAKADSTLNERLGIDAVSQAT